MKVPTGGKAHDPLGMIRLDSEADSTVWMKEDYDCKLYILRIDIIALVCFHSRVLFFK